MENIGSREFIGMKFELKIEHFSHVKRIFLRLKHLISAKELQRLLPRRERPQDPANSTENNFRVYFSR